MARKQTLAALAAFIGLAVSALPATAQNAPAAPAAETAPAVAQPAAAPKAPPKDIVLKGDGRCTTCHDENDSPEALKIGKTRHGVGADKRTPTCASCHGESVTHEKEAGRGGKKSPPPEVAFGKKSKNTAEERNKACLSCHQGANRISWQSSAHATRDVACTSCHQIHTPDDKVRNKVTQTEVCYTCHKEQRMQMSRQSRHPVPEGKMSCASCHNVHSDNPKGLVKHSTNETCYTCHMEKRGPFVHNHEPVSEDCGICHNPHGTNVANLLKNRPPIICVQCHGADSHPSQPMALPKDMGTSSTSITSINAGSNSRAGFGTAMRGCLNCHTNIHGGNSTQSNATAERFRR